MVVPHCCWCNSHVIHVWIHFNFCLSRSGRLNDSGSFSAAYHWGVTVSSSNTKTLRLPDKKLQVIVTIWQQHLTFSFCRCRFFIHDKISISSTTFSWWLFRPWYMSTFMPLSITCHPTRALFITSKSMQNILVERYNRSFSLLARLPKQSRVIQPTAYDVCVKFSLLDTRVNNSTSGRTHYILGWLYWSINFR